MNFIIFRDFSEFILDFKCIKTNKKITKSGLFLCGTHVDATWHARPWQSHAGPRERLRGVEVMCHAYLYLFVI